MFSDVNFQKNQNIELPKFHGKRQEDKHFFLIQI